MPLLLDLHLVGAAKIAKQAQLTSTFLFDQRRARSLLLRSQAYSILRNETKRNQVRYNETNGVI